MHRIFFIMDVAELHQILLQRALYMYCSICNVLFIFRNFNLHSAVHRLRVTSVCGQREYRGSRARIAGIESQTPTVPCKTVAVTNMSNKPKACCPQGREQAAC